MPSLRVLVIISRPLMIRSNSGKEGQAHNGLIPISLPAIDIVRDGLRRTFEDNDIPVQVCYLPWARLGDIQAALAERYDVVHMVAHGTENGYLLLETDDGLADPVEPERFGLIMRHAGVQLAVLSTCFSGRIGRELRTAGIPNVIMVDEKYPMDARAEALFNRQFYARLTRGFRPSEAFQAGLNAVRSDALFGDTAPPPRQELSGVEEPRYGERFTYDFSNDQALLHSVPEGGYVELRPVQSLSKSPRPEVVVGREAVMVEIIRLLQDCRVVTLTGPGGIGKTTIARAVGFWYADRRRFRAGIVEVNATEARNTHDLAQAFINTLGLSPEPHNPWGVIQAALSHGRWLVLLDNADDVADGATRIADSTIVRFGTHAGVADS